MKTSTLQPLVLAVAACLPVLSCSATTGTARVTAPAAETSAPAADGAAASGTAPAEEAPAAPAVEQPQPETYNNTIKWTTASEVDNFGFDVFRGDGPDGPFERINVETIEGAGTVDEPQSYRFVDDTIDPRRTYYYYVESIAMDGVRERFTPVGKAGPKIKPEADEAQPEVETEPEAAAPETGGRR